MMLWGGYKNIMKELIIRAKDIKILLSRFDVSKSMAPDEIHTKYQNTYQQMKVLSMQYLNCLGNV